MGDLKKGEEYLSGAKKRDKFYPVLHIVVYFGKKHWKAARKMEDLFWIERFPEEVKAEGGGFDMCKAIKEMLRDSRLEGRQEGRQEGKQEGRLKGQDEMATLSEKLILADRISELLKASTDREFRNKLLLEFGLA